MSDKPKSKIKKYLKNKKVLRINYIRKFAYSYYEKEKKRQVKQDYKPLLFCQLDDDNRLEMGIYYNGAESWSYIDRAQLRNDEDIKMVVDRLFINAKAQFKFI